MKLNKIKTASILLSVLLTTGSCSDFLEPEDSKYVESDKIGDVLERTPDAIIQGVYSRAVQYAFYASRHDDFGQKSLDLSVDFSGEDLVHYSNKQWFITIYQLEDRLASERRPGRQWQYNYANIRDINTILAALSTEDVSKLTDDQRYLKGEALALRAFHYFQLINLFQTGGAWEDIKGLPGVPVYKDPSLEGGSRGTVADVYTQILSDYEEAIPLLEGYDGGKGRLSQTSAQLLAARAYLYAGQYDKSLALASAVVDNTTLMATSEYSKGFADLANVEWLWGVDVNSENSTSYASFFSIIDNKSPGYAGYLGQYKSIDRRLYDNIKEGDVRKTVFAGAEGGIVYGGTKIAYAQFKFVDPSQEFLGDLVYLRSAEAYYIKAEAQVRQGDLAGAKATLDLISNARALNGKHSYTWASDATTLIDQIFVQKRIELWGEGQSQFEFNRLEKDIDRTYAGTNHPKGNIIPGGDHIIKWHDALRTLQIPVKELEGNPQITTADQNP